MCGKPTIFGIWVGLFLGQVLAVSAEIIYQEGTNALTRQQFVEQLGVMDLGSAEEYRREILIGKAGKALLPYYRDLLRSSTEPVPVGKSALAIIELADDPSIYRDDLLDMFSRQEIRGERGIARLAIPVLEAVGRPEDCELLYPLLLEDPAGEVRAHAAELLAKIGDSDTLAKVRSLVPELVRLRDEDLAKLVERRAVLLGSGWSQAFVNRAIAQQEETIARNFERIRTAIDRLEERLDAESGERGLPGGTGFAPEEGAESNGREPPSGGAPSPAGPRVQAVDENRAVAVAFGESRGGSWSPAAVAVVVLVLVLSLLCICMLLRVRRRRRR